MLLLYAVALSAGCDPDDHDTGDDDGAGDGDTDSGACDEGAADVCLSIYTDCLSECISPLIDYEPCAAACFDQFCDCTWDADCEYEHC